MTYSQGKVPRDLRDAGFVPAISECLRPYRSLDRLLGMSVHEIAEAVMELPEADRLELARRIVSSVVAERKNAPDIEHAIKGIEDVLTGRIRGLSEAEFERALQ